MGAVKKFLKNLLLFGLAFFLISNIVSYLRSPAIDEKISINAALLDGKSVSLDDYKGKPTIIYFWASWCPTCKLQSSAIDELSKEYQVLTVALNSGSDEDIKDYMNEKGYAFATINDKSGNISRNFKVKALPTTFVIDSNGSIVFSEVGYTSGIGFRLRLKMAK